MRTAWSSLQSTLERRPWLVLVIAAAIALPTLVLGEVAAADTRTRLHDAQLAAQTAATARAARRVSFILGDVASNLLDSTGPDAPLVTALARDDSQAVQAALLDIASRYTYTPGYFYVDPRGVIVAGADSSAVAGPEARVIGRRSDALPWATTPRSLIGTQFMTSVDLAATFAQRSVHLFDMYLPHDRSGDAMAIGTWNGPDPQMRPGEMRTGYIAALGIRVADRSGRFFGALIAQIHPAPFADAMLELQGISANAYLVDNNGRLVRRLAVYVDDLPQRGQDMSSAAVIVSAKTAKSTHADGIDPLGGMPALLTTLRAPDVAAANGADLLIGWTVISAEPLTSLYSDVDASAGTLRAVRIALAIGIMVFAILLTIALGRVVRQRAALADANASLEQAGQELSAATRHKSEFLANMSHELRTPLNSIIGFADVLAQKLFGDLNAKQAEYVGDISGSGRHLLALVNEILDLSKVEAGRMEIDRTEFSVGEMVRTTLTFVEERAASHAIQMSSDVSADIATAYGDERKIRQVLLNLLSNAIKFTPAGGSIRLTARRENQDLEISVADSGIGIAPEDQPRVFDEFRQVGAPGTRPQEGTGLGLTLAKRFVELHGGRIWLESAPGRGTTFTISLPILQTSAAPLTA